MRYIIVSRDTHRLIAANTQRGYAFRDTALALPDGTLKVPIGDDTAERIEKVRLAGESDDDLIQRLLGTQRGAN